MRSFFPAHRLAAVLAFTLILPLAARAAEFNQLLADKSTLSFMSKQMNVPTEGRFKSFRGQVRFDPAQPTDGRIEFELDLASIDLGITEANDEARGKDWFDVKRYPTARFVSSRIKALGSGKFEVSGQLSIKGKTREVTTPVSFTQEGAYGVFAGSFGIRRSDYAIGEGMWAAFDTVANEVDVRFRLLAATAKK